MSAPRSVEEHRQMLRSRDESVLANPQTVAGGLAIGIVFYSLFNWFRLEPQDRWWAVSFNFAICLLASCIWLATKRQWLDAKWANPVGACVFLFIAANILFTFYRTSQAAQTHLLTVVMLGAGFLLLSLPWLLAVLALMIVGWVGVLYLTDSWSPGLPFTAALVAAVVLAIIFHTARWHHHRRLQEALALARREAAERQQTKNELAGTDRRYRHLFEQSRDVVTISSLGGRLLDINRAGIELFGYESLEQVLALNLQRDVYVEYTDRSAMLEQLQKYGFVDNFETRMRDSAGKTIIVAGTTSLIEDADVEGGKVLLAILRDVTSQRQQADDNERRRQLLEEQVQERTASLQSAIEDLQREIGERERAEEERRQAEVGFQQAQKLESLGLLAGGIAHDFNNLMTAILGNIELVLLDLPQDSPVRPFVEEVEKAGQRATELANQMLAYSGGSQFHIQPVDLGGVASEMKELLQISISKKIDLIFDVAQQPWIIEAEETQLRQVVMNLIINAAEAIGDEVGTIKVRIDERRINRQELQGRYVHDGLKEGRYLALEVKDSGCGMAADTLAKLFDPFFTTKVKGRGLGMAAVLGIVRGHHGAIRVDSQRGKGTCFTVLFPPAEPTAEVAIVRPAPQAADWSGSGTVLVVDDEASVRLVLGRSLERFGFEVAVAVDGVEALEIYQREFDIVAVFLDLTMPRLDGEQTFAQMQQMRPGVPVVIISGYSESEVMKRFTAAQPQGVLKKPFRTAQIRHRLQAVLAS